jgi:hypothetical protein
MIPPPAAEVLERLNPLTFALTGLSKDKQVYSALGTGFFVAPYTALTAAHVVRGLWDKLEMPWKEGKYPNTSLEPEFYLAAVQQVHFSNELLAAHWEVTGVTPLSYTDIAFLNLVPKNEVAAQFLWPKPFPELELLPPPVGTSVWAFGYPDMTNTHTPGQEIVDFEAEPTLMGGEVTEHYSEGRAGWRFPQFHVTCPFEPGMSGGPVIHGGRICGLISYGLTLENKKLGPAFAAAMWPLLASEGEPSVDPRQLSNPVVEMLNTGAITASDWKDIQSRITRRQIDGGESIVALKL